MTLDRELWKEDKKEGEFGVSPPRMSLFHKIGIGMAAGLIIPFLILFQGLVFPGWRAAGLIALFGPVFGGAMAYFMNQFQRVERSRGELVWVLLSGGMAGGFTSSLAYNFEYLTAPWTVPGGVVVGAAVVGLLWWHGNT